jgi:hypothetical protein
MLKDIVSVEPLRGYRLKLTFEDGADVIHHLKRVGKENKDGWNKLVIPFATNAWPKELRYQIESSSSVFVSMLVDTGDGFPLVLDAVRPSLRPIHHRF